MEKERVSFILIHLTLSQFLNTLQEKEHKHDKSDYSTNSDALKYSKDSSRIKEVDYNLLNKFIDKEIKENRLTLEKHFDNQRNIDPKSSNNSNSNKQYNNVGPVLQESKNSMFKSNTNFELDLHNMHEDFVREKLNIKKHDKPFIELNSASGSSLNDININNIYYSNDSTRLGGSKEKNFKNDKGEFNLDYQNNVKNITSKVDVRSTLSNEKNLSTNRTNKMKDDFYDGDAKKGDSEYYNYRPVRQHNINGELEVNYNIPNYKPTFNEYKSPKVSPKPMAEGVNDKQHFQDLRDSNTNKLTNFDYSNNNKNELQVKLQTQNPSQLPKQKNKFSNELLGINFSPIKEIKESKQNYVKEKHMTNLGRSPSRTTPQNFTNNTYKIENKSPKSNNNLKEEIFENTRKKETSPTNKEGIRGKVNSQTYTNKLPHQEFLKENNKDNKFDNALIEQEFRIKKHDVESKVLSEKNNLINYQQSYNNMSDFNNQDYHTKQYKMREKINKLSFSPKRVGDGYQRFAELSKSGSDENVKALHNHKEYEVEKNNNYNQPNTEIEFNQYYSKARQKISPGKVTQNPIQYTNPDSTRNRNSSKEKEYLLEQQFKLKKEKLNQEEINNKPNKVEHDFSKGKSPNLNFDHSNPNPDSTKHNAHNAMIIEKDFSNKLPKKNNYIEEYEVNKENDNNKINVQKELLNQQIEHERFVLARNQLKRERENQLQSINDRNSNNLLDFQGNISPNVVINHRNNNNYSTLISSQNNIKNLNNMHYQEDNSKNLNKPNNNPNYRHQFSEIEDEEDIPNSREYINNLLQERIGSRSKKAPSNYPNNSKLPKNRTDEHLSREEKFNNTVSENLNNKHMKAHNHNQSNYSDFENNRNERSENIRSNRCNRNRPKSLGNSIFFNLI